MVEVDTVLARTRQRKAQAGQGFELSYALLTALTGRLRTYTAELTKDVWMLEQRVTGDHLGDPESFLDEMFRARHGLLTVSTMSALSREVYSRWRPSRPAARVTGNRCFWTLSISSTIYR
jgi:hypothetical protein